MRQMIVQSFVMGLLLLCLTPCDELVAGDKVPTQCMPTEEDEMGPFYRPGAPLRSVLGTGYLLTGTVRSSVDCTPLGAALIEFWMTGPDGRYSDAYRAAIITGKEGRYRLETDYPGFYASRPVHIHIRARAEGFRSVTTQHYPEKGADAATFDLILLPLVKP